MATPTSFQIRLPRDLAVQVRRWARQNGLTPSAAIRDLVRQAMFHATPLERGWHEGWTGAHADYMRMKAGDPVSKRKIAKRLAVMSAR